MAGNAGNWFKIKRGPLKGQSIYLSKQQQADTYKYQPTRADIIEMLSDPEHAGSAAMIARYANAQLPAGAAGADKAYRPRAISRSGGAASDPALGQGSSGTTLDPIGRTDQGYLRFASSNVPMIERIPGKPQVIVMAGLPASGKSTLRNKITDNDPGWAIIDADEIKKTLPGYDPKNPGAVHAASMEAMFRQVEAMRQLGADFVWDVTGTNPISPAIVELLQERGYAVTVVHVDADLETVRARNAARERSVPDWVITSTADMLPRALSQLRAVADTAFAVDTTG